MRLRSSPHAPNLLQGKRHQWHMLAINVCLPQVEYIKSGKYEYPYQDSQCAADGKFLNETMLDERISREVQTSSQNEQPVEPGEEEVVDGIEEGPI
jgi:hypothetical protein